MAKEIKYLVTSIGLTKEGNKPYSILSKIVPYSKGGYDLGFVDTKQNIFVEGEILVLGEFKTIIQEIA